MRKSVAATPTLQYPPPPIRRARSRMQMLRKIVWNGREWTHLDWLPYDYHLRLDPQTLLGLPSPSLLKH